MADAVGGGITTGQLYAQAMRRTEQIIANVRPDQWIPLHPARSGMFAM